MQSFTNSSLHYFVTMTFDNSCCIHTLSCAFVYFYLPREPRRQTLWCHQRPSCTLGVGDGRLTVWRPPSSSQSGMSSGPWVRQSSPSGPASVWVNRQGCACSTPAERVGRGKATQGLGIQVYSSAHDADDLPFSALGKTHHFRSILQYDISMTFTTTYQSVQSVAPGRSSHTRSLSMRPWTPALEPL